jgi:hypothetical protein
LGQTLLDATAREPQGSLDLAVDGRWQILSGFGIQTTQASAYKQLNFGSVRMHEAARIWKSWAPPKVKFFTWLAIKRLIWTADRLHRHGLEARRT